MGQKLVGLLSSLRRLLNRVWFRTEPLGFTDRMQLVCRRRDGTVKWVIDTDTDPLKSNSMAETGMAQIAGLLLSDVGGTAFDYVGIGTSGTAESAGHTDLQTPLARKTGAGTRVTTSFTNDTAQLVATFSSSDGLSGTSSVQEGGVFTAASSGVMGFRKIFTAKSVNWTDGDTLEVTAKCQVKQGT
jgi:hypothetical protein